MVVRIYLLLFGMMSFLLCCFFVLPCFGSSGVSTLLVSFKMTIFVKDARWDDSFFHPANVVCTGTDQASRSIEEAAECHGTD